MNAFSVEANYMDLMTLDVMMPHLDGFSVKNSGNRPDGQKRGCGEASP